MMNRFADIADAFADVASKYLELTKRRTAKAVLALFAIAAGVAVGVLAVVSALAALTVWLTELIGLAGALAIAAGAAMLLGVALLLIGKVFVGLSGEPGRPDESQLEDDVAEALEQLRSAALGEGGDPDGSQRSASLFERATEAATRNPSLTASAVFAAASTLGPRRSARFVMRAGALASAIKPVLDAISEDRGGSGGRRGGPSARRADHAEV